MDDMIKASIEVEKTVEALVTNVGAYLYVHPCTIKGDYTGSIRVKVRWLSDNAIKHPAHRSKYLYVKSGEGKRALRWIQRNVIPEIKRVEKYIRILALYRESGLIPIQVCKDHRYKMNQRYGPRWHLQKHCLDDLLKRAERYVERYGKCPECGRKGEFFLSCSGFCCGCGQIWYDLEVRKARWRILTEIKDHLTEAK